MECMLLLEQGQSNSWASLVAHKVKNLLVMQETQVPSLSQEDPLKEEVAAHSSIFAWRIPWTEGLSGYSPWGHKESDTTEWLSILYSYSWTIYPSWPLGAWVVLLFERGYQSKSVQVWHLPNSQWYVSLTLKRPQESPSKLLPPRASHSCMSPSYA